MTNNCNRREMNLAVESQITILSALVDLSLMVWYTIAMYMWEKENLADFSVVVGKEDRQTAKFNSPAIF